MFRQAAAKSPEKKLRVLILLQQESYCAARNETLSMVLFDIAKMEKELGL